jgi:hypothetical protein
MLVCEMLHIGWKRSGNGKDLSMYALKDYSVVRQVMVKLQTAFGADLATEIRDCIPLHPSELPGIGVV